MALTLAIAAGSPGGSVVANQAMNYTVTVTNTAASSVSLASLRVYEQTKTGARVSQPRWSVEGQPPGSASQPTIGASSSVSYPFQVVFNVPNMPGVSATNPGGAAPGQLALEVDPISTLMAEAQFSDGSTGFTTLTVPVLSAVYPFPVSDVGTLLFHQGGNSNLIAVIA